MKPEDEDFHEEEERKKRVEKAIEDVEAELGMKEGAHVRYIGVTDENDGFLKHPQYCGSPCDPRGILDFDTIYEIECMLIYRSFSLLKLVGFGKKTFSPSIFEPINRNEEKKCLKAGGYVRYVGPRPGFLFGVLHCVDLDAETIYEVESVEMNSFGYTFVKLVGFKEKFERECFEKVKN